MAGDETDGPRRAEPEEAALLRDAAKAERYQTMRERGRQIGGVPGAMVAGLMIALRDIYDPPPKRDDGIPMVEAPGDPHDVDRDGMASPPPTSAAATTSRSPPSSGAHRSSGSSAEATVPAPLVRRRRVSASLAALSPTEWFQRHAPADTR